MLKGLEISEVNYSVLQEVETFRFDSEYFQKKYLFIDQLITYKKNQFEQFNDFKLAVDASAFYPSLEPYYGIGDFPFLRVKDVDTNIDYDNCVRIPLEVLESSSFKTLRKISKGDIVITKGGSIARIGLIEEETAVTRDLIFINSSKLPELEYKYLFLYLLSSISYNQLVRSSSMTAQPHLTITLVRNLKLFNPSLLFKNKVVDTYELSKKILNKSKEIYRSAERILLKTLNLENFQPIVESANVKSFSESFGTSGRLDAEYYQAKFDLLDNHIRETGSYEELGRLSSLITRGTQPIYLEEGEGTPVINSKHVRANKVILEDNRVGDSKLSKVRIQKNDVLINGTGVGTIGRTATYLYEGIAIPDNHVTIIRTGKVSPIYLSVYLNSICGQLQVDKYFKGSSGQIELYPDDISKFLIWIAPMGLQNEIELMIKSAFELDKQSNHLLEVAKTAVEIAIGQDEDEALKYIQDSLKEF